METYEIFKDLAIILFPQSSAVFLLVSSTHPRLWVRLSPVF